MFEFQYKIQKNVASDYKTFPIVTSQFSFFNKFQNFLHFIRIFFWHSWVYLWLSNVSKTKNKSNNSPEKCNSAIIHVFISTLMVDSKRILYCLFIGFETETMDSCCTKKAITLVNVKLMHNLDKLVFHTIFSFAKATR